MQKGLFSILLFFVFTAITVAQHQEAIPLPEHPRPDFERSVWMNLNGSWAFRFDPDDKGRQENWQSHPETFTASILVPFPWGAPQSGVKDEADIAWYGKTVSVPDAWKDKRTFLTIGASDWLTTVWIDGRLLGSHQGGYTPFSFELTPYLTYGKSQQIVIRVDDKRRSFTLYGKQGYGNARGLWQTVYLEARGTAYLDAVHFTPDIDNGQVKVEAMMGEPAKEVLALDLKVALPDGSTLDKSFVVAKGADKAEFQIPLPSARRWTLEDPYLYQAAVTVRNSSGTGAADEVASYFGMRKISVRKLPGTDFPYVALNDEPVYLQLTLDQSYHPEGYYTFPTDEFMRNEILMARQIGLTGIRTHVKIDIPRKLYWADKLGVLVMSDVPNSWGEPDADMQKEVEYTMGELIKRDYNHPSIFQWVIFNETWGLFTEVEKNGKKEREYLPETREFVANMVRKARAKDATRLVEDNSICCGAKHTETDINSWHVYLAGFEWEEFLKGITEDNYPGSEALYYPGYKQGNQPNINSEMGNVWGYQGSTGDVDWSWDYHRAVNTFRKYPEIAGWLYTEHHDVVNEWNGYWRYDRSEKETGLSDLVEGMSLKDLHAPIYLSTGQDISYSAKAGETVKVPLFLSAMTGRTDIGSQLTLKTTLYGWDELGQKITWSETSGHIEYTPWMQKALAPLEVKMPGQKAVAVLAMELSDAAGLVLHHNLVSFIVDGPDRETVTLAGGKKARIVQVPAAGFSAASWSQKQWNVLDGLKVDGAGSGYFEYEFPLPAGLKAEEVESVAFLTEASAKQLFGKDREGARAISGDFMLGAGTHDPSLNPNAYPMTDEEKFPSAVSIWFDGKAGSRFELEDDPADHRGILSWHMQPQDKHLYEAGSYGYLLQSAVPVDAWKNAMKTGRLRVRLAVDEGLPGGLAIYGSRFGRYPVDPTLIFVLKK